MSTEKRLVLSKKNESILTAVALIVGLAIGIVVQQLTDKSWLVIIYVLITVFGAYLLITMPFANSESDFIPSQHSFHMVWGLLLTTLGVLLLVSVYASNVSLWIYVVVLLVVVAVIGLLLYMKSGGSK